MKSRVHILLAAAILASSLATASDQTQIIKLATLIPDGSVWDRTLKTMGAEWLQETEGHVRLRIYGGGIAGDDPDLIRKLRIGQLQAATVTVSGLTEIDPAFALFEIPMFFDSYAEYFHVLDALEPELEARLAENGFMLLHWGQAGWVYFFASRPAAALEEFRELGVFVWAGNDRLTALWRDHGFRPVPLAATDILTGLKTGMFQAMPSTPIAALSLQWFRSAPHMLDLPITPLLGATLMTRTAWEGIPSGDRAAVMAAAARAGDAFRREIPEQDARAIEEMKRRGLTVLTLSGDEEAAWMVAADRFAVSMSEAFVPRDFYARAETARDAYRRRSENGKTP